MPHPVSSTRLADGSRECVRISLTRRTRFGFPCPNRVSKGRGHRLVGERAGASHRVIAFSYATLGELVASIIGWDLIFELALGAGLLQTGRAAKLVRRQEGGGYEGHRGRSASRHGASRHGASRHGASRHGASRYGASRYGASRYGASRHGAGVTPQGCWQCGAAGEWRSKECAAGLVG